MKAKELFTIILKIFGIYLVKDIIMAIPPVVEEFFKLSGFSISGSVISLLFSVVALGLYLLIVYLLLFKTSYLISKLKLTDDLSEEPMKINMHRSTIYTIAIIVTGLLILVFAIPGFVRELYYWYQFIDLKKSRLTSESFDFSWLLVSATEVIIGLLFLGNQRTLVNYIELKSRKAKKENA